MEKQGIVAPMTSRRTRDLLVDRAPGLLHTLLDPGIRPRRRRRCFRGGALDTAHCWGPDPAMLVQPKLL